MNDDQRLEDLSGLVRHEIAAAGGVIPFARFMELALYAPGLGYYERSARPVGRGGDFYTSVSVGPVFGELLAFQFARWLDELAPAPANGRLHLVEAGAHDGRLAADILGWLHAWHPDLARRVELWLVEPSAARRAWQAETLASFAQQVNWVASPAELGVRTGGIRGVLYANELLDAFPVHRFAWDAAEARWHEVGVAAAPAGFAWERLPAGGSPDAAGELQRLASLPRELLGVLPDGFTTEASPVAVDWWRKAAGLLRAGWLATFDYGLTAEEFLSPERRDGTLRTYRNHRPGTDPLADPGGQDLTAHVNFTALEAAGQAVGLRTDAFIPQRRWLTEVFAAATAPGAGFPPWDSTRVRQFQTLTHPEHLGRAFRVLVQRR